jgi:hypothetical protein
VSLCVFRAKLRILIAVASVICYWLTTGYYFVITKGFTHVKDNNRKFKQRIIEGEWIGNHGNPGLA